MDDPWWNIRCYLPRREVAKLFTVIRQIAEMSDKALTAARAVGDDRSPTGSSTPPDGA